MSIWFDFHFLNLKKLYLIIIKYFFKVKRRNFISASAVASVGLFAGNTANAMPSLKNMTIKELKGNINHSACRWCYSKIPLEELLQHFNKLGIKALDLTGPEEWPLMKKYGIHASMCWGAGKGILEGFNDPKLHAELIADYTQMIPKVAEAGYTNLICFSGKTNAISRKTRCYITNGTA